MKTILIGRRQGKTNWEILSGPETTTSDQITIRQSLMKDLPINDTWAQVWLLEAEEHIKGPLKFVTAEQAVDQKQAVIKADADLENAKALSEERARQQDNARKEKRAELHQAEVEGLNKLHDIIRNQISPVSSRAQRVLDEAQKQVDREKEKELTGP